MKMYLKNSPTTINSFVLLLCLLLSISVIANEPYSLTFTHVKGIQGITSGLNYNMDATVGLTDPITTNGLNYFLSNHFGPVWPSSTWTPPLFIGDLNGDYRVDIRDLELFSRYWLNVGCSDINSWCGWADFDYNHRVDILDFLVLAQHWLQAKYFIIYQNTLDNKPNWYYDGQWDFGKPDGKGGTYYGYPDPAGGGTGNNVWGVNLHGDYNYAITSGPYFLGTEPINCSGYENIKLIFARWLNTDEPGYVASKIEVSADHSTWFTIWEHTGNSFIEDNHWQEVEYNLGNIANNVQNVYLRWSYEILNGNQAYPFSGWNIDDVELWGNLIVH